MSIQAVGWVLDNSRSRGLARLVLISLANHANADDLCWPAQRTIAKEAGVSNGTVANMVSQLVGLGEIEVVNAGDQRRSSRYRLLRFQCSPDERSAQVGVSAVPNPGVSRSIKNRHEEDLSAQNANPDCVQCWGNGFYYHAGAGSERPCECTRRDNAESA